MPIIYNSDMEKNIYICIYIYHFNDMVRCWLDVDSAYYG